MNKMFESHDSYCIVDTDASDTLKIPESIFVTNSSDIPLVLPYTDNTSADNTNFSTELQKIKTEVPNDSKLFCFRATFIGKV